MNSTNSNNNSSYGSISDLLDLGSIYLSLSSLLVIIYAAYRSKQFNKDLRNDPELQQQTIVIQTRMALIYPIIASVALILFFYFFGTISFLLMFSVITSTFTGIYFSLNPVIKQFSPSLFHSHINLPCLGEISISALICHLVSFMLLSSWMVTGSWLLNNIIGMSFCVMSLLFIKIPNGKIATLILTLLFLYDIFWVFFSKPFFGESVMLSVATRKSTNPLMTFAQFFGFSQYIQQDLHPPIKLISWNGHILGLGDIFLPGMVVCMAFHFDILMKKMNKDRSYFKNALIGYSIGLLTAQFFATILRVGQPALLYIVPSTLAYIFIHAYKNNEIKDIWNGIEEKKEIDIERAEST